MKYSTNNFATTRGFTLIELLIVIAIIGVLAATVVVSLGDQTDAARRETMKLTVSSIRTSIFAEAIGKSPTGTSLCDSVYEDVSIPSGSNWTWDGGNNVTCEGDDADKDNEVCCHSSDTTWVIWAKLTDSKVYCADSNNFLGEVTRATTGANANVQQANNVTKPTKCIP